jgi:transcriptional regulator with XRE-family HTH domain
MCWTLWSKAPMPRGRPVNQQRRHKIVQLRAKGLSLQEIAKHLGVTRQLVQRSLKLSGNTRVVPIHCEECTVLITQMRTVYDNRVPVWCLECLAKHPKAAFGQRLRVHRLAAGMTRHELARKARISATSVIEYELGNKVPGLENLTKLTRVLGSGLVMFE